jgi:indolepyruvate ferredoxin oxidoreductase beta subunit
VQSERFGYGGGFKMKYDVFMVGVGGQGILSIGEIIASAALAKGIPVNFYPSKGMAQRGGFVKASLRLGGETVGPNIAEKGADLVLSMEVSESLKAIRYVKPGGDFVLLGNIWAPTAVMLGKAGYPSVQDVIDQSSKPEQISFLSTKRMFLLTMGSKWLIIFSCWESL